MKEIAKLKSLPLLRALLLMGKQNILIDDCVLYNYVYMNEAWQYYCSAIPSPPSWIGS